MTIADQLVTMANDYISGRQELAALDAFVHDHVDESLELDKSGRADALLFGFIQARIYEMDDGLSEVDVRRDVENYLTEHQLLRPPAHQRATG